MGHVTANLKETETGALFLAEEQPPTTYPQLFLAGPFNLYLSGRTLQSL